MRAIKTKADELALLGKPMYPEDLIEQILAGLPEEYKVDAVNGRENLISFSKLTEKLLNREAMLLCEQPTTPFFPVTANLVTCNNRGSWRPSFTPRHTANRDVSRTPRPYSGKCQKPQVKH